MTPADTALVDAMAVGPDLDLLNTLADLAEVAEERDQAVGENAGLIRQLSAALYREGLLQAVISDLRADLAAAEARLNALPALAGA